MQWSNSWPCSECGCSLFLAFLVRMKLDNEFPLKVVVAIAGAFHDATYPQAAIALQKHHTFAIVHHHVKDKLCPWEPVAVYWNDLGGCEDVSHYKRIYINAIDDSESKLWQGSFHDVCAVICGQIAFWQILSNPSSCEEMYQFCVDNFVG